jgi:hypothetical protein
MPVLPPCGINRAPTAAQSRTTSASWPVSAGRSTAGVVPWYNRRQSSVYPAVSGPVRNPWVPSNWVSCSSKTALLAGARSAMMDTP